ncbi:MAG: hypothetical protein ACI4JS_08040 [Oscillospiraceae bacterium]
MTKQIREYLEMLERFFREEHSDAEMLKMKAELLQRIAFYSHERLVHLIITMSFAVFFLLVLFMCLLIRNVGLVILAVILLAVLAAYIKHYYFLENSVQKMYLYFYKLEKIS